MEGLDRINEKRGFTFCLDLSATPYFLGRVGQDANRPFPWQLTATERGGRKANPKPEAILEYANTPIAMLAGLWQEEFEKRGEGDDPRPPVFIIGRTNVTAIS